MNINGKGLESRREFIEDPLNQFYNFIFTWFFGYFLNLLTHSHTLSQDFGKNLSDGLDLEYQKIHP